MATAQKLGLEPALMELELARGGDFVTRLINEGTEPWPTDATLVIAVGEAIWPSENIGGTEFRFHVDKSDVLKMFERRPRSYRVIYTDPATEADLVWFHGPVVLHG